MKTSNKDPKNIAGSRIRLILKFNSKVYFGVKKGKRNLTQATSK